MKPARNSQSKIKLPKRTKAQVKSPAKTKGWDTERRLAQAARLRRNKIWLKSTGPRTEEGKKIASKNALKNGPETAAMNRFFSDQNRYLGEVENWSRMRIPRLASKSTFSATFEAIKYHEKMGYLLGKKGRELLVSGIQFLEENNG